LQPGKLIESIPYNLATKEGVLSGTALEWLNLKKERFVKGLTPTLT